MQKAEVSRAVWRAKYCLRREGAAVEHDIGETWRRVARAAAAVEHSPDAWQPRFEALLGDYVFLPGGRILAGAGSDRQITLFNCFVAGQLDDSLDGILRGLKETAITMQHGGGVGIDFSPLRPSGSAAVRTGAEASGPVSFMRLWDVLCETLLSTSTRRGAMMGTLACDHPDLEAFVAAKERTGELSNFNLSILISDRFMQAVADDAPWPLAFPSRLLSEPALGPDDADSARVTSARRLWRKIAESAHATAEPGVLFIDTINRENNLRSGETIRATNPCGEIPLPPYGACNLGSINLVPLVEQPFTKRARVDHDKLYDVAQLAVRFLDNIIDTSQFPLEAQARQVRQTRRIGLGITGLADAVAMLGMRYSSDSGRRFGTSLLTTIRDAAYEASVKLAGEKGAFPVFDKDEFLEAPFVRRLPEPIRAAIKETGIRNSHLLSIAPAGTISLLAGNVSSGIEPIYALEATRAVRDERGELVEHAVRDFAYAEWLALGRDGQDLPPAFETAASIPAAAHLAMQASLQPFVDNAISKTINLPAETTVDEVAELYSKAHAAGVKGCTVYRPGASVGRILRARADTHCCTVDREPD